MTAAERAAWMHLQATERAVADAFVAVESARERLVSITRREMLRERQHHLRVARRKC